MNNKTIALICFLSFLYTIASLAQDTVLCDFNGNSYPGQWTRKAPVSEPFVYHVQPDRMIMHDAANHNQNLMRKKIFFDPAKPYAVEVIFRILDPLKQGCCNSFGLLFNIADTNTSIPISAMKLGLNLHKNNGGDINVMGYNKGKYNIRATIKAPWAKTYDEYKLLVYVNASINGKHKDNLVSFTFMNKNCILEQAQVDYTGFPYRVDKTRNISIGFNAHGANWVVKKLKAWYIKP